MPAATQASVLVLPVNIESGIEWAVLDADSLEIVPLRSVDPLRPVAHVRANGVEIGVDRLLSKVSRAAGRAIATSLLSAEAVGIARWATDTASGTRRSASSSAARSGSSRRSSTSAPR